MITDEVPFFRDLVCPHSRDRGKPVKVSEMQEHVDVFGMGGCVHIRLWYDRREHGEGNGFDFYVTRFAESSGDHKDDFEDPALKVECLFHGIVYYDGLRHLYLGDEQTKNEGYLYYLKGKQAAAIFTTLRELEEKHCNLDLIDD